jgi:hypothetical protein
MAVDSTEFWKADDIYDIGDGVCYIMFHKDPCFIWQPVSDTPTTWDDVPDVDTNWTKKPEIC